ncbi:MAG: M28 family peptidase, partial [Acidobacteria bacterium]|nr:M28 family peptidase [Acidobacteriota bacterium]
PGANDNASGCATILEVARSLAKLVREGRLPRPRRTIRFVWPAEIEVTIALLTADTAFAERTAAVIHMDMVGGDVETTKAVFHVTRSPKSLPTFVNDVAEELARFVNRQSEDFAGGGSPRFPLADPEGGKEAWLAQVADFSAGSDHQVWAEGSFRVPTIYFNDWPDRYIHTHADSVANIDATKLLRAAFVGAASAYALAQLDSDALPELVRVLRRHGLERTAEAMARADQLRQSSADDAANHLRFQLDYERRIFDSLGRFAEPSPELRRNQAVFLTSLATIAGAPGAEHIITASGGGRVYRRRALPKGPLSGFGYSYFEDKLASEEIERPQLLDRQALWGGGSNLAYEALNLVDGERSEARIGADLSAIFGPVPQAEVAEFLRVLESIGLIDSAWVMPDAGVSF